MIAESESLLVIEKGSGCCEESGSGMVFLAIHRYDKTMVAFLVVALQTVSKINSVRGEAQVAEPSIHQPS